MSERFTCPRRAEDGTDDPDSPLVGSGRNKDRWERGHGLVGQRRGCSYCGSMNPDDFMDAVRAGETVGPTDKSYKVYLSKTPTEEQKAEYRQREIGRYVGTGLSEEEAATLVDQELPIPEGEQLGKFYLQHLSEEQRRGFFDLYVSRKMVVGYPGHFYVLPFFMRRS